MRTTVTIGMMCLCLATTGGAAKTSLRDVARVENGLFHIAVADKIRKECDAISGRVMKALGQMRALSDYALGLGYSEDEIRAYVKDEREKNRMSAKRDAYLRAKGVVQSDPETYCAAGRAEIQNATEIGALLRAR